MPVNTLSSQTSTQAGYGGQSMVGRLRRVLVCDPRTAGWDRGEKWRELGFLHPPDVALAEEQHRIFCEQLQGSGADVVTLQPGPGGSLDSVYVHDASFITNRGALLLRLERRSERQSPRAIGTCINTWEFLSKVRSRRPARLRRGTWCGSMTAR